MTKKEHFEKFDKEFEELEVSPYNASEEYFNAGWKCGTEEAKKIIEKLLYVIRVSCFGNYKEEYEDAVRYLNECESS